MSDARITVTVTETITYEFPSYDEHCPAHGQALCIQCAKNPGNCLEDDSPGCGYYSSTGMHWDTCPNRIR